MSLMCAVPGAQKRRRLRGSVEKPTKFNQKKHPRHSCSSIDSGILLERSQLARERARSGSVISKNYPLRKLVVLQGFKAATRDELDVTRGEVVNVLEETEECDWVLVENLKGELGYIPVSYSVPLVMWQNWGDDSSDSEDDDDVHSRGVPSPRRGNHPDRQIDGRSYRSRSVGSIAMHGVRISAASIDACYTCELCVTVDSQSTEFHKKPEGVALALYSFRPRCEDDASLTRGDWVVLLNTQDPDWVWVRKKDGSEGFVPKIYLSIVGNWTEVKGRKVRRCHTDSTTTPMLVEWSYEAVHESAVSIKRGEIVYADIFSKTNNGWLWVHVPRTGDDGFIPATFARALIAAV